MKKLQITLNLRKLMLVTTLSFSSFLASAQTNVFDDVIATSPNHTSLTAAINAAGLASALQNPAATLTVFAPTNDAFNDLAAELGVTIPQLLVLPNLSDILLYHVLGTTVSSSGISNGQLVTPLNPANTIKLTVTGSGSVYANHAMVNAPDLTTDNGVVHSIDAVILDVETVVDVALDNGFSSLATAVITAELLPALTDPFASLTVFAPDNTAFTNIATALGTDITGLLALPNLADILTYHVLGAEVLSTTLTNGQLATPLNAANTIKVTVKGNGDVFVNHAEVTLTDVTCDNGVVHAINAVILPSETVVDVALDNGFSTLATAVITAELLPALTNPLTQFTVFAPTNAAFATLATDLGTDLNGVLALPFLADVLLYHVVAGEVLSTALTNGSVPTLNGQSVVVDLSAGVMINTSNVTTPDVQAENGVVHVIDKVLLPNLANIENNDEANLEIYPNPASDIVTINAFDTEFRKITILGMDGRILIETTFDASATVDISTLAPGQYIIKIEGDSSVLSRNLFKS